MNTSKPKQNANGDKCSTVQYQQMNTCQTFPQQARQEETRSCRQRQMLPQLWHTCYRCGFSFLHLHLPVECETSCEIVARKNVLPEQLMLVPNYVPH